MATANEVMQLLAQIGVGNRGTITQAVFDAIQLYDPTFNSRSKVRARNSLGERLALLQAVPEAEPEPEPEREAAPAPPPIDDAVRARMLQQRLDELQAEHRRVQQQLDDLDIRLAQAQRRAEFRPLLVDDVPQVAAILNPDEAARRTATYT
jgi:hypothetical protein